MTLRNKIKYVFALLAAGNVMTAAADDCEIHLMTCPVEQLSEIPAEINEQLMTRFSSALASADVAAGPDFSQFFLTGKFSDIYKSVVPGPPKQNALHTTLTVYVGDIINQTVYATCTFDLRGVGTSEQRAYINALSQLNGSNKKLAEFIDGARAKIIKYYDNNYRNILSKAKLAASMRNYEEAMMYATSIPECSVGYPEAMNDILEYYMAYIDYEGQQLLTAARTAWAESPDKEGAVRAHGYLLQIDPAAACYPDAVSLMNDIKKVVKENWDFENKEKYHDAVDMRNRMIEAARAVGVAYGNGQQPTTTNLMWLR